MVQILDSPGAPSFDLLICQGATYQCEFDYYEPDGTTLFPWPVGATAELQIRDGHETLPIYLTLTNGQGLTLQSPGKVFVTISETQTQSLENLLYKYDLKISFLDGTAIRLTQGKVKVSPDITQ